MKEMQVIQPRSFVSFDQALRYFGEDQEENIEVCELCGWYSLKRDEHSQGAIVDSDFVSEIVGIEHVCHECTDELWTAYEQGELL